MSCDHELANEKTRCSGKNASYITMKVVAYGFSDLHVLKRNGSKKNFFFFSASQDAKPKHTGLSVQRYKCLVQGAVG